MDAAEQRLVFVHKFDEQDVLGFFRERSVSLLRDGQVREQVVDLLRLSRYGSAVRYVFIGEREHDRIGRLDEREIPLFGNGQRQRRE